MTRGSSQVPPGPTALQVVREVAERRFASVWVQAVPSRWPEPLGLTAREAMIRGTAIVASASGGLVECVQHGETGLLVPSSDAAALADALTRLLQDRGLAERPGKAGRQEAPARFRECSYVDPFVRLYERLRSADSIQVGRGGGGRGHV